MFEALYYTALTGFGFVGLALLYWAHMIGEGKPVTPGQRQTGLPHPHTTKGRGRN